MKKAIFTLILVMTFPLIVSPFNLRIDLPKIKLTVKGQETLTGTIKIENPTSEQIEVKAYLEDFRYVPPFDGTKEFFPPGSTNFSCAPWINFSPQEFVLGPFAKRMVSYSIKVPVGVKGGHYAVLFFETSLGEIRNSKEGANILILGRIGSLFFLETANALKNAQLENLTAEGSKIKGEFANNGEVVLVSKGNFYVMDEKGIVVTRGKIDDLYLFPQDKAPFTINLSEDIPAGRYTVVVSFDLEQGDVLVNEIDLIKERFGNIRILEVRD